MLKEGGIGDLCCHDGFDVAIEGDSGVGLGGHKMSSKGHHGVIGGSIEEDDGLFYRKERKP